MPVEAGQERQDHRRPTLVARHESGTAASGDQEIFDLGPPVDAILDAPCDAEIFDDCAYDTMEEYPYDEAC